MLMGNMSYITVEERIPGDSLIINGYHLCCIIRSAVVHLHCDQAEQPRITAEGDKVTALSYVFHLYTKEVCFSGSGSVAGYIGLILILL